MPIGDSVQIVAKHCQCGLLLLLPCHFHGTVVPYPRLKRVAILPIEMT